MHVNQAFPSLCAALDSHAMQRAEELAIRFLHDGDVNGRRTELSFGAFHARAISVARTLQEYVQPGDRALLLYEGGPDFIIAFLGCLYAGVIAVPTYPPDGTRIHRTLPRLQAIAEDARARLILTTSDLQQSAEPLSSQAEQLKTMIWLPTDRVESRAEDWQPRVIEPGDVAYLQYTSGSTGSPKGVIISHENLAVSCQSFYDRFLYHDKSRQVFWLPTFHDLGLVWGLLTPLYGGLPSTFMLPTAFLQRPARWLEAITHFRGTHTAGPNFAYELCIRKIGEDSLARLDLSTLCAAMNAAEPVRASTIRDFIKRFESVGFRPEAMCPGYGLAEATVPVSLAETTSPTTVLTVSASALEQHRVVRISDEGPDTFQAIGCGRVFDVNDVAIVDPDTGKALEDGFVGEVWVAGPVVARGYWRRSEATEQTFGARLEGDTRHGAAWLRTGDLGFLHDKELFICGRLKDLIIVRGRNLYPQDIELAVERAHAAVRAGCVAAFSLEISGEERIGLVVEIDVHRLAGRTSDELLQPICVAVADAFDVQVHDLVIVPPRAIFKTSSGKVERRRTRTALSNGTLETLARWTQPVVTTQDARPDADTSDLAGRIWNWLRDAKNVVLPDNPMLDVPFQQLGLDSVGAVEVSGRIAEALGRPMPPTLLFYHPTLRALVKHLTSTTANHSAGSTSSVVSWDEPIAIISMACRFPGGSETPEAFWQLLDAGTDAITDVPRQRWDIDAYFSARPEQSGKTYSRWGGFLGDVAGFDAPFFGLSNREASSIDPQGRLLLEAVWEVLERAGIAPNSLLESRTGVYMGLCGHEYEGLSLANVDAIDGYSLLGTAPRCSSQKFV